MKDIIFRCDHCNAEIKNVGHYPVITIDNAPKTFALYIGERKYGPQRLDFCTIACIDAYFERILGEQEMRGS